MHNGKNYFFFVDYHHIIVDGTSMQILLHDIDRAYRGEQIAAEELTMMQVAIDEVQKRETPAFQEAKQWYAQNFDCSDTFTQLAPDLAISTHSEDSALRTLFSPVRLHSCLQSIILKMRRYSILYLMVVATSV